MSQILYGMSKSQNRLISDFERTILIFFSQFSSNSLSGSLLQGASNNIADSLNFCFVVPKNVCDRSLVLLNCGELSLFTTCPTVEDISCTIAVPSILLGDQTLLRKAAESGPDSRS